MIDIYFYVSNFNLRRKKIHKKNIHDIDNNIKKPDKQVKEKIELVEKILSELKKQM